MCSLTALSLRYFKCLKLIIKYFQNIFLSSSNSVKHMTLPEQAQHSSGTHIFRVAIIDTNLLCLEFSEIIHRFFVFLDFIYLFILTSLLEYECFTMVCQFLLYNKVNQLYIYIYPHISSFLHLPPSHPPYPTPLGGHKAPS